MPEVTGSSWMASDGLGGREPPGGQWRHVAGLCGLDACLGSTLSLHHVTEDRLVERSGPNSQRLSDHSK